MSLVALVLELRGSVADARNLARRLQAPLFAQQFSRLAFARVVAMDVAERVIGMLRNERLGWPGMRTNGRGMHLGQLAGFERREDIVQMVRMPLDAILLQRTLRCEPVEAIVEWA